MNCLQSTDISPPIASMGSDQAECVYVWDLVGHVDVKGEGDVLAIGWLSQGAWAKSSRWPTLIIRDYMGNIG
jgi:hypothetical protein